MPEQKFSAWARFFFDGDENFYERIEPKKGIYYFITGAGGKLHEGDVKDDSPLTEKAFDRDLSFMLIEAANDELHFQAISRTGATVDSGMIKRRYYAPRRLKITCYRI